MFLNRMESRFLSRLIRTSPKFATKRHWSTVPTDSWDIVPRQEVKRFIVDCMSSVKTSLEHAEKLADNLCTADYRGHYSHGLNRLDMYVRDIETGITEKNTEPITMKETAATALVNGQNVLGPVVGEYSMDLAINKAKQCGVGWVVAQGSNHFGIAGWYAMKAVDKGLLGLSFTNTSPLQVPTRARKPALGTNPISLAVPAKDNDSFVLDMATTTVALGKIELHDRKQIAIPDGWGVDSEGKMCNVAKPVIDSGGLMPLGGSELTGGYKGYGLAMLVEIFCGILAGSDYGPHVRRWKSTEKVANLGQCFIAVDPECFAPGFTDRMSDLMGICRNLTTAEGEQDTVLVAGDPEKRHMETCDARGGIPYHPSQIKYGIDLAKSLKVEPMKILVK